MLYGKTRKPGKFIEDISIGENLTLTEKIEDKDILLYLGLTNDANPLYIQHDYASKTMYKKPLVPAIMLTGLITSAISKYIPGPGSYIVRQEINFIEPVYHYELIQFHYEVTDIHINDHVIELTVSANNEENMNVLTGTLLVRPPSQLK